MHGLRCDPALLGWTRLLDEWVVGLTRYNRSTPSDPVCWEDRGRTLSTLADAATQVRSFAYRDTDIEPTVPLGGAMLSLELQGRPYRGATDQHWPSVPDAMAANAGEWLQVARTRANEAALEGEIAVGVVFIAPRLPAFLSPEERFEAADSFIGASRSVRCSGCAFSFPDLHELPRYRYGNEEHPGALLLLDASPGLEDFSA